jgi:hypothetical protein
MSSIINNAKAWSRRGWTRLTRRRISAESAYPWTVVAPLTFVFKEGGWAGAPMPDGTEISYNVFWFLADVPASLNLTVNGLTVPGFNLSGISAVLFGAQCTNVEVAETGTQFLMQHSVAGAVLGYPSRYVVPNFFSRLGPGENNSIVLLQAIANGGVLQGPPYGLPGDNVRGWIPIVIPVSAYTAAIKADNNLIVDGPLTYQVVGLYLLASTPIPPGP